MKKGVLIAIIIVSLLIISVLFIFRDDVFAKITTKTFSDGCIETYKNDVPITILCADSRAKGFDYVIGVVK